LKECLRFNSYGEHTVDAYKFQAVRNILASDGVPVHPFSFTNIKADYESDFE